MLTTHRYQRRQVRLYCLNFGFIEAGNWLHKAMQNEKEIKHQETIGKNLEEKCSVLDKLKGL